MVSTVDADEEKEALKWAKSFVCKITYQTNSSVFEPQVKHEPIGLGTYTEERPN